MRRAAFLAALALALACGVKGPPLPPLREAAPVDGGSPPAPSPSSIPIPSPASPAVPVPATQGPTAAPGVDGGTP